VDREAFTQLGPLDEANLNHFRTEVNSATSVYTPAIGFCQREIIEQFSEGIVEMHLKT
jgi:hypothetical protein